MAFLKFLLILSVFILLFVSFRRKVYFGNITCVQIAPAGVLLRSVKPNKRFFRSVSLGRSTSFVSLGSGYIAYCVTDPDSLSFKFKDYYFSGDVYIFKCGKFGRLVSVDCSDRCLSDIIIKFKEV